MNRRPADWRPSGQLGPLPFKMVRPGVSSGMKEMDYFASLRIPSGEVRALVLVAVHAREGKVLQNGFAAVLASHDVIDVEG